MSSNLPGLWRTWLVFSYGDRRKQWVEKVGTSRFPIVSLSPYFTGSNVGENSDCPYYELDLEALGGQLRGKVIEALADMYEMSASSVEYHVRMHGVPIMLDRDITLGTTVLSSEMQDTFDDEEEPQGEPRDFLLAM